MKNRIMTSTISLLALSSLFYTATGVRSQPLPPAPPPEGGPRPGVRPAGEDVINGTVEQYLLNSRGEADGLYLKDGTQLNFPPHMSAQLTGAVKPGSQIKAKGMRQGDSLFAASEVKNSKSDITITDNGPPREVPPVPPVPPQLKGVNLKQMKLQSPIKALLHGPRGDVNGFLLADQTVVRMPPETAFKLADVLKVGERLSVEGYGTENTLGKCVEATALGTANQPLISIYGDDPHLSKF